VQKEVIPLVLLGKDVLAKASTGSGKTLAYAAPIIHKILESKLMNPVGVKSLMLVPTKELAQQVTKYISNLLNYSSKDVTVFNVSSEDSLK
jgi:ATP-dependent RNA helicase DDX56/DBP9